MVRWDGREADQLRPVRIIPNYLDYAEGSALIEMGQTRVLCAASLEERVPPFLEGKGQGWITAEYALLPRSTLSRTPRESVTGRVQGRTHEIQRLIGRSLRAALDLKHLGPRTITLDCDVIQADGGTRCAAITGGYVALVLALRRAVHIGLFSNLPPLTPIAAVSVGLINGIPCLDLNYQEDSAADADANLVMTGGGRFIEIQITAEKSPFDRATFARLVDLAENGIRQLFAIQQEVLGR